ncbi:MAG: replication initiation protein [Endozoicomonas sp.]|uniref:replication initiation protein n=1 Tax=Endozoicomonas sp. TaxID=1892382 RepID=UPI003D9BBDB4
MVGQVLNSNSSQAEQLELLDPVDRFYQLAPKKPYCTNDLNYGLVIRSKDSAFSRRYVQHNPPAMCHWLTFDQDHEHILMWEKVRLPEPNLIVRNLDNRRAHVSYAIESVCTSEAGNPKPIAYASAVQEAYTQALKADACYTNFITKNPYHDDWHVWELHRHVYSLGDLADSVDLVRKRWTRKQAANDEYHGLSRNCALFNRLRYWAYDHISWHREQGTRYQAWMNLVLEHAENNNTFPEPLPYSEIKSTAKSVGKWVWKNYWPEGRVIRRGVMSGDFASSQLPLDLKKKQRLSARRTNELQRSATESKIIDAIGLLTAQGKKVTKAAVARVSGVGRRTIYNQYTHLFLD